MTLKYNSKAFIKLQTQWYKKLAKQHFNDIEWHSSSAFMSQNSPFLSSQVRINSALDYLSTYNYYSYARLFLRRGKFATSLDRTVWRMHSRGYSYRVIVSKLLNKNIKRSVFAISRIVNTYKPLAARMGIDEANKSHLVSAPPLTSNASTVTAPVLPLDHKSLKQSASVPEKIEKFNISLVTDSCENMEHRLEPDFNNLEEPDTVLDWLPENNNGVCL